VPVQKVQVDLRSTAMQRRDSIVIEKIEIRALRKMTADLASKKMENCISDDGLQVLYRDRLRHRR